MSVIVGLTGPTGSGKSTAALAARELGIKVVDCDLLSRKATEKGSDGLSCLVNAFGDGILNDDKTLNRKALARVAFRSLENTELLNKTVLPHIEKLVLKEIEGCDRALLDAPTLFESGIDKICDKTFAVLADKAVRRQRIIKRDNISAGDADLRIGAGKPDEFYRKADLTVYNNGDMQSFYNEAKVILNNLFGGNING